MKYIAIAIFVFLALLLTPLAVAGATNADILAILNATIDGILKASRDAYCASGVAPLCPK